MAESADTKLSDTALSSVAYKFAGGDCIDPSLEASLSALNSISVDDFDAIIAQLLTSYLDPSLSTVDDMVDKSAEALSERTSVRYKSLVRLSESVLSLIRGAIKYNLTVDSLTDDLTSIGLESDRIQSLCDAWTKHYVALSKTASEASVQFTKVVDMKWKFCVTASTDSLAQCGNTFLQLKLTLDTPTGIQDTAMGM